MRTHATPLAALALTLSLTAPALADGGGEEPKWAKSQGFRIGLEADVLTRSIEANLPSGVAASGEGDTTSDSFAAAFAVVAQLKLVAGLHLDAELPFFYGSSEAIASLSGEQTTDVPKLEGFAFGNPTLGLHYAANMFPTIVVIGGLAASIPITPDPSDDTKAAASASLPIRGYFDTHRTFLEHVPLRARGGVEVQLIEAVYARGDLVAMFAIPTDGGDTEFFIESGNEVELRSNDGFGVGARLQAAFPLTETDKLQLAAEPFIGLEPPKSGLYLRAGLLVALDEPLGFGLDNNKLATVRVAAGGKF